MMRSQEGVGRGVAGPREERKPSLLGEEVLGSCSKRRLNRFCLHPSFSLTRWIEVSLALNFWLDFGVCSSQTVSCNQSLVIST